MMVIYFAEEAGGSCALRRAQITTVTSKAARPLTFLQFPDIRLDLEGRIKKKREIVQMEAFLEAMLKGNQGLLGCWSHSLCLRSNRVSSSDTQFTTFTHQEHPLQEEVDLVLMLSNRSPKNGAVDGRNHLNWVTSSHPLRKLARD